MLWSKQYYYFDLDKWLHEHDAHPLLGGKSRSRNAEWSHMLKQRTRIFERHPVGLPTAVRVQVNLAVERPPFGSGELTLR